MMTQLRAAILSFLMLTLLTGVAYPLVVTAIAQAAFPRAANGSLIMQDDQVVGSELIGRSFGESGYFWGRPSATGPDAYNGAASTGSNLGSTNPALLEVVQGRIQSIRAAHPDQSGAVPIDLVTASGSGLDPHVSPAAAQYQVTRVAKHRGLAVDEITALVAEYTEGRTLGVFGERRVNILRLNLALDRLSN
jgi:K+-transporting ATPase ATPase C chain